MDQIFNNWDKSASSVVLGILLDQPDERLISSLQHANGQSSNHKHNIKNRHNIKSSGSDNFRKVSGNTKGLNGVPRSSHSQATLRAPAQSTTLRQVSIERKHTRNGVHIDFGSLLSKIEELRQIRSIEPKTRKTHSKCPVTRYAAAHMLKNEKLPFQPTVRSGQPLSSIIECSESQLSILSYSSASTNELYFSTPSQFTARAYQFSDRSNNSLDSLSHSPENYALLVP